MSAIGKVMKCTTFVHEGKGVLHHCYMCCLYTYCMGGKFCGRLIFVDFKCLIIYKISHTVQLSDQRICDAFGGDLNWQFGEFGFYHQT